MEADSVAVARLFSTEEAVFREPTAGGGARRTESGISPDDQRENVIRNRELLAEAVTGDPATPLATLRQIHSNVLIVGGPSSDCAARGKPLGKGGWAHDR